MEQLTLPPPESNRCPTCGQQIAPNVEQLGKLRRDAAETSRIARLRNAPRTGTQRERILRLLLTNPMIDEQIATTLRMSENTVRPRRGELIEGGWVRDSGTVRQTRSGDPAIVWTVTQRAIEWAQYRED